jgi:hypothetical protein
VRKIDVLENPGLVESQTWAEFLADCANIVRGTPDFDNIRELLLALILSAPKFPHAICAILLKSDTGRSLSRFAFGIFDVLIGVWREPPTAPFLTVLFGHSPEIIAYAIAAALANQQLSIEFKIEVITKGLQVSQAVVPFDAISRFVIFAFKKGAMHMVGRILLEHEEIGVALLADGAAKAAFLLTLLEKGNSRAYLRFIQLCLSILQKYPEIARKFAEAALRLSVETISKYGGEMSLHSRQIASQCVYILQDSVRFLGEKAAEAVFEAVPLAEKSRAVGFIAVNVRAEEQRKKTEKLIAFSTNERSSKSGEWQSFDVLENSDSN